jgi:hypothetical protein
VTASSIASSGGRSKTVPLIRIGTDVICDTLTVTALNETNVGDSSVTECTSVVIPGIFQDGFESGDTSLWSSPR